ncbi:hypothetical protein [Roseinatronobacter alkalisoli]|uniref:Uncharacterized protein n=1 Tax=Roseinatronobacter alkalisoli TaxID=3028235 RepID=A0ABT5T9H3_9RHOB|nr:hypothetical protein [Roseinatronobacter sp. HJB301]MDD7971375.1 hypothetical protein [Roseinatronobacter sp. HJB301]
MTTPSHPFLIDMLAMNAQASAHGCGLNPRLRDMLLDRHARHPGIPALDLPIRHDGPAGHATPEGLRHARP